MLCRLELYSRVKFKSLQSGLEGWLTVTRRSRSREGNVEGAKCSLRSTHCLIMFNLLRMARTLVSGEPEEASLAVCLKK